MPSPRLSALDLRPLVEAIYDASTAPERWLDVLDAIRARGRARSACLWFEIALDAPHDHVALEHDRLDLAPETLVEPIVAATAGVEAGQCVDLGPDVDGCVLVIARDATHLQALSLHGVEPGSASLLPTALDGLHQHLGVAIDVEQTLDRARHERDALAAALRHAPFGVVILDARRALVEIDDTALAIVSRDLGPIRLDGARGLLASDPVDAPRLEALLRTAGSCTDSAQGLLRMSSLAGEPALEVRVFTSDPARLGLGLRHRVTVVLLAESTAVHVEPDAMKQLHHLSNTEAEVAALLLEGHDTKWIGEELGLTTGTVRSITRRLLYKTGASRQTDLISRLLRGAVRLRA